MPSDFICTLFVSHNGVSIPTNEHFSRISPVSRGFNARCVPTKGHLIPTIEYLRGTNTRFIPNNEHHIPTIVDLRDTNAACNIPSKTLSPI